MKLVKEHINESYESYSVLADVADKLNDKFPNLEKEKLYYLKDLVKIDNPQYSFLNDVGFVAWPPEDVDFYAGVVFPKDYNRHIFDDPESLKWHQIHYPHGIIMTYKSWIKPQILVHELQHIYDFYISKGLIDQKTDKAGIDIGTYHFSKQYYNSESELNAHFSHIFKDLNLIKNGKIVPFKQALNIMLMDWKDYNYQKISPKNKKRMIKRFSQYYYKIKEKYNLVEDES